jgi:hypothetical protein
MKDYWKEINAFIVASLFMVLILSLKIQWPKIIFEPIDFLWNFLFVILMFGVFVVAQKITAEYNDCSMRLKLISFRRFWFAPTSDEAKAELPFDFPAWIFLPLIALLAKVKWLAIFNFDLEPKQTHARKKWSNLTEMDVGRVAIAGPIAVIILGLIMKIFALNDFAYLCMLFAFLSTIPIGQGFKLFMSSRIMWFFALFLSFIMLLLIGLNSIFAIIVIAVLLTIMAVIAYYVYLER